MDLGRISPPNEEKKPGKFKRLMEWVDRKICGGAPVTAKQPDPNTIKMSLEQRRATLTPK
jgi:hypothetical protein